MKKNKQNILPNIIILSMILLIALCFSVSIGIIENDAKEECFEHIEDCTMQISDMFSHAMTQSQTQLTLFADILAANSSNPDELLQTYMEHFCETLNFSAVCVHKENGSSFSYGFHPHNEFAAFFEDELKKLPYVSDVHGFGDARKDNYIYLAVPIIRAEKTVAILYGYISLDTFPSFISSTAYDGKIQLSIVDGNTGDFLMDEYHRYDQDSEEEIPLGNAFDDSMENPETKSNCDMKAMRQKMQDNESGYFIFKSRQTGTWYYTYFMPLDINSWFIQITIDEPSAFEAYYNMRSIVIGLMLSVIFLGLVIIIVLLLQSRKKAILEAQNLHKADYQNQIQSALLTAHNNPDFVDRALKLIAREMQAETALLLTFEQKLIKDVYYWPSGDKTQANALIGLSIQDMFPSIFDALMSNDSFFCNESRFSECLSLEATDLLKSFDVRNIMLVPIADSAGMAKGTIAAINVHDSIRTSEMLECVTKDFYMAITNLENHNIIKQMGAIDYLTGIKNRNSYETELTEYETANAETLWCVFVDANGLHEINNTQGHKAGDIMLYTIAATLKKIFGEKHCYRLGGDEFVAFLANKSHEELMNCKYRILNTLNKKGYSVSIGFEGASKTQDNVFDVESLLSRAEEIMYSEKRKYYESSGKSAERNSFSENS